MTMVSLTVNGKPVSMDIEPRTQLADLLRGPLGLTGTHLGCEQGVCGACTVLVDGVPQRSCIAFAVDCEGAAVTTIEGFDGDPVMGELREAFSAHHALQCGFCTPGMLVSARDTVLRLGEVSSDRIRHEMSGNLCRCTGYVGIVDAIGAVCAGKLPQAVAAPAPVVAPAAPAPAAPVAAPMTKAPAPSAAPASGGSSLEERITVQAPAGQVWAALSDLSRVASCLPGAELDSVEGDQLKGRMRVALGPIKVAFAGEGTVQFDPASRQGTMTGKGRDSGSGSSASGEVRWQVLPAESDPKASVIIVALSWRLTGALAQFNRAGLVADVVRRLAATFAGNLEASLSGGTAAAPVEAKPISLLSLLWGIVKARLFGR